MPNKEIIFFFAFVFSFCEFIVFGWFAEWTWFLTWSVTLFQSFRHLVLAHTSLFITKCNKLPANNRLMHLRKYKVLLAHCSVLSRNRLSIQFLQNTSKGIGNGLLFILWTDLLRAKFTLNWQWIVIEYPDAIDFFYILFEMFSRKKKFNSLTSCGHDQ